MNGNEAFVSSMSPVPPPLRWVQPIIWSSILGKVEMHHSGSPALIPARKLWPSNSGSWTLYLHVPTTVLGRTSSTPTHPTSPKIGLTVKLALRNSVPTGALWWLVCNLPLQPQKPQHPWRKTMPWCALRAFSLKSNLSMNAALIPGVSHKSLYLNQRHRFIA